jgi:hypothetical protein
MPRTSHGDVVLLEEVGSALNVVHEINARLNLPFSFAKAADLTRSGYIFRDLQNKPADLLFDLPPSQTVKALKELGRTMSEPGADPGTDSDIPSAYTYFGQFIDHDITLLAMPKKVSLSDPDFVFLSESEVAQIKNVRTPTLDLDSVYGEAPHDGDDLMLLGKVTMPTLPSRPPGIMGEEFDLPREDRSDDRRYDRAARIGDGRNEENAIIAQLHVAFLRAHNAIVLEGGYNYYEARSLLRKHYQWIVVHDFLRRVCDPSIVEEMLAAPWEKFDPVDDFFLPLEFTGAAFRFGHSMVRPAYDFNVNFPPRHATLLQLFNVMGRYLTLPEKWIIEWEKFLDGGTNKARKINTVLVEPLFTVPGLPGLPVRDEIRLAVRNLLRGYLLRMPTGQAVARSLGVYEMTPNDVTNAAASQEQAGVLEASGFATHTPLWFYILAEAAHFKKGHLGPVGSTLVAGVLIALIRRSKDSFLKIPGWTPTLPAHGMTFELRDLLRLAGVLKSN